MKPSLLFVVEGGPSVTFIEPKIRAVSAPPGPLGDQSAVTPGALPLAMTGTSFNESPQVATPEKTGASLKLQKQQSFTVTTVYTPPSNPSKAIQKLRAKTRAAKAFKNSLPVRLCVSFLFFLGGTIIGHKLSNNE